MTEDASRPGRPDPAPPARPAEIEISDAPPGGVEPDPVTPAEDPAPVPHPAPASEPPAERAEDEEGDDDGEPGPLRAHPVLTTLGLLGLGLLIGVVLLRLFGGPGGQRDAIAAAARAQTEEVPLALETDDPDAAQAFLEEELGWRVNPPLVARHELQGVGVVELIPDVEVPFLRYTADRAGPLVVLILDYAFLDAHADALGLGSGVYARLADERVYDVHQVGDESVILWRDRDDILAAVTTGDPAALVEALGDS